jgi:hypothetical protein
VVIIGIKMAIHIFALQIASIVPCDNAVGVNNRNHPYFVDLSQLMAQQTLRDQIVDEAMNNETTVRFSWMLTAYY